MAKCLCDNYENRAEWCVEYPWNTEKTGAEVHPQCQWMVDGELIPEEELEKTPKEIESYCFACGRCCFFWDDGRRVHKCTGLRILMFKRQATLDGQPYGSVEMEHELMAGEKIKVMQDPDEPSSGMIEVLVSEMGDVMSLVSI